MPEVSMESKKKIFVLQLVNFNSSMKKLEKANKNLEKARLKNLLITIDLLRST